MLSRVRKVYAVGVGKERYTMNLEAIKAAIAWFENQRDGYDDARKRALANGAMSSTIKNVENIKTQIDTVLAALREAEARREGCEWCMNGEPILQDDDCADVVRIMLAKNGTGSHYLLDERDGRMQWAIKIVTCPMCGRRLERSGT